MADEGSKNLPPSEKLSGVTLTMPINSGRDGNSSVTVRSCQRVARRGKRSANIFKKSIFRAYPLDIRNDNSGGAADGGPIFSNTPPLFHPQEGYIGKRFYQNLLPNRCPWHRWGLSSDVNGRRFERRLAIGRQPDWSQSLPECGTGSLMKPNLRLSVRRVLNVRTLLIVALVGFANATANAQNLAGNPGFEQGPANTAPWLFSGIAHMSDGANSHTGDYEAQFSGSGADFGSVSQSILTTIGQQYLVDFWATSDGYSASPGFGNELDAFFGTGELTLTNADLGPLNGTTRAGYTEHSFDFTATSTSTLLSFSGSDGYGNMWVDDVSVTAATVGTPEPGSIVLLGIGIAGLCVIVRRRKARPAFVAAA